MKNTLFLFNTRKTKIVGKYTAVFVFAVFPYSISTLYADDDESPTFDLFMESKTADISANCAIQNTDTEKDKERIEIGVGETVNLELNGKRLGEVTSVKWEIKSGETWASIEVEEGNDKKAVLTAKKNPTVDGSSTVEVTTNIDSSLNPPRPRQKTFQIRVPSGIKGKHSGKRVAGYPQDGDKMIPGASSMLIMTLSPLSVTFKNIIIKERSHEGDGHDTGTGSLRVNARNESTFDRIGRKIPDGYTVESPGIQNHPVIGQSNSWSCRWYTYADGQFCCHISGNDFVQLMKMERDGIRRDQIHELKVTVSKFGASTSRSTAGEAKHNDRNAPE